MVKRFVAVDAAGAVAESLDNRTALSADVTSVLGSLTTANYVTIKAATSNAISAMMANVPSSGIVVGIDTSIVTTKNKLRQLLDAAYNHIANSTNIL